jgi:hypothetical protein
LVHTPKRFSAAAAALASETSRGEAMAPPAARPARSSNATGAPKTCGVMEHNREYHTSRLVPHGRLWDIGSAELCCAECEAHPECGAWTWGQAPHILGMSDVCLLQGLGPGEKPKIVEREGVVGGLPSPSVRKHGVVAALLHEERRRPARGAATRTHGGADAGQVADRFIDQVVHQEREAEVFQPSPEVEKVPFTTCRGSLNVSGYGAPSVVAALWREPGRRGREVELPSITSLKSYLGSRVYLADTCTAGIYNQSQYVGLNLLGKRLRYTVDVSGAGCGCRARLQLLPLRSNGRATACADHYCDANETCGVACAEINIQDSNQYTWSSRLHAMNDRLGVSIGNGARGRAAQRDWTSADYAPGGDCIDTSWPFEVSVSFPVGDLGGLSRFEVVLTQAGRSCSLSGRVDAYDAWTPTIRAELTGVLAAGVTPVISYQSYEDLLWLDGINADGEGPCLRDVPQACPDSVRFYGFAVEAIDQIASTGGEAPHDLSPGSAR